MKGNNKRDVHAGDVIGVGEHHGEVPKIAAAVGRRHGAGVGEQQRREFWTQPTQTHSVNGGFWVSSGFHGWAWVG